MVQVHTLWCGSPNQSQAGPVFSHYNRSKMIQSLHGVLVHHHSRGGLRGLCLKALNCMNQGLSFLRLNHDPSSLLQTV